MFKKKFIDPREYTIESKDGSQTFIKDEIVSNKKQLEELRQLVCPSVPSRKATLKILVTSAKSLLDMNYNHLKNSYNKALVTSDINIFFKYMGMVQQDFDKIEPIENYVYYTDMNMPVSKYTFPNRYQIEIRHLIDRAYGETSESDDPDKACRKAYKDFQKWIDQMDGKSIQKLNSKFKKYVK